MAGILIVDDDPTIRAMFARALKALGDIDQAGNGGEALRLLGAKKYGVVLLDLHMPIIDGFVLLHTLANKPGLNRDTPIYVISADNSDQARIKALKRHAVFMLTKPVPIATLTALVDATLKKAAAQESKAEAVKGEVPEVDAHGASGPPSALPASQRGSAVPRSSKPMTSTPRPPASSKKP
jgi:DNA-binding response OmpR family regulator